jgi:exonuclease SbcC
MKTVILQQLSLLNFKGAKNRVIDFNESVTNIYGTNGTGKTTIVDAYFWLLFGKDSSFRSSFGIKPTDQIGTSSKKLEIQVEGVFLVDGVKTTLTRTLKEKWVKERGSLEHTFKGNETIYEIDGVPMKESDYSRRVSEIVDESVFKMVSIPGYFAQLPWQEKRNILTNIVGEDSDEMIAEGNEAYQNLLTELKNFKTIEEYNKSISASVKKSKEELQQIPSRIDEVERTRPEVDGIDFDKTEKMLSQAFEEVNNIDTQINDANKAMQAELDAIREKKNKHNNLLIELNSLEAQIKNRVTKANEPDNTEVNAIQKQIDDLMSRQKLLSNEIATLRSSINTKESKVTQLNQTLQYMREEYVKIQSSSLQFKEGEFCCPACKRDFEPGQIEAKKNELLENFNKDKQAKLDSNQKQGKANKEELAVTEAELTELKSQHSDKTLECGALTDNITELQKKLKEAQVKLSEVPSVNLIAAVNDALNADADYQTKKKEVDAAYVLIGEDPKVDNSALVTRKAELNSKIDELKKTLAKKEDVEKVEQRVEELEKRESELAVIIAEAEKKQFTAEQFNIHKIELLEKKINKLFKMVRFKMFDKQVNGALNPTCEATINGVPYSDANTASKINAGIDIINTLCKTYNITAPIFIDGRESVVKLLDSESQIINLIVDADKNQIEVSHEAEAVA